MKDGAADNRRPAVDRENRRFRGWGRGPPPKPDSTIKPRSAHFQLVSSPACFLKLSQQVREGVSATSRLRYKLAIISTFAAELDY
jgi:hypothetical protein